MNRVVADDPAGEAAERLAAGTRPGAHLVLTGGSTPRSSYERLSDAGVDWTGTTLWFSDERCVPPDHEQSNYRMVAGALLERIDGPAVRRMEGERGPDEGAALYERALSESFGDGMPAFDLVLLGLGPDAHTCSLFPGDPALAESERRVVGIEQAGMQPFVPRITLTLPVVNAAREVMFLVTGEDKAEAVSRSFSEPPDPTAPGALVRPVSGSLTLILDAAAAEGLAR